MTEEEKSKLDEAARLFVERLIRDKVGQEIINKYLETTLVFDWKTGQATALKNYGR